MSIFSSALKYIFSKQIGEREWDSEKKKNVNVDAPMNK